MIDAPWTGGLSVFTRRLRARARSWSFACRGPIGVQRKRERERESSDATMQSQLCIEELHLPAVMHHRGHSDGNYVRRNVEIIVLINGESMELYIGGDGDVEAVCSLSGNGGCVAIDREQRLMTSEERCRSLVREISRSLNAGNEFSRDIDDLSLSRSLASFVFSLSISLLVVFVYEIYRNASYSSQAPQFR